MAVPTSINLSDTSPAAPTGKTNVNWQSGPPYPDPNNPAGPPVRDVSANMPTVVGDTGSGGTSGAVPAPGAGDAAAGKFLKADGTWKVPPTGSGGGGGGSVTSVGLSMPPEFAVANSPVTTADTLTVTKQNEPANQVWAGPSSGAAAAPAFRALVVADVPPIPVSGVTGLQADLDAKAPLASPAFTGTPTAPTATGGDSSTKLATTAFVGAAIAALPASVPASRHINTTSPLTGGGDLSADRTLAISVFAASGPSHATGAVPDPGATAGTTRFLREDASWAVPPTGSGGGGGVSITFNGV